MSMLSDTIFANITRITGFAPTLQQCAAAETFSQFYLNGGKHSVMILRGNAGTGKTSLAGSIVKTLSQAGHKVMLLAPTGRAAKVFSGNCSHKAFTIHRVIYRQRSFDSSGGQFNINFNRHRDTLFIVDEASMIPHYGLSGSSFGTGCLLDDLISFVYGTEGCRMLLVGDEAQLPPVGEDYSPALNRDVVAGYGLDVYEASLTDVVRQEHESGILANATMVRHMLKDDSAVEIPKVIVGSYDDVAVTSGEDLLEQIASCYSNVGVDETMIVTRSNKRADIFNMGIRARVLGFEEELTPGDIVMIVKNNYYWPEKTHCGIDFIANGDRALVRRVRHVVELYGFRFADVTLRFPDYDDMEIEATVILDTLHSSAPSLTHEQSTALYDSIAADYADVTRKDERLRMMREDKYFNALQIKYAYAVTCHKAQGGQWSNVFVDQGYLTLDMIDREYLRWLYTAFTRSVDKLFLVNWPDVMIKGM